MKNEVGQLVKVTCKVTDVKDIPNSNMQLVAMEFTLGEKKWKQAFRFDYPRKLSMEEFVQKVASKVEIPPDPIDCLAFVKEEMDKPFEIEVPASSEQRP